MTPLDRQSRIGLGLLLFLWLIPAACTAQGQVPERCRQYQRAITTQANSLWGINDPPTAILAAQVQQESACNPMARSPFANGLTQFTPGTAADMAKRYPTELGAADPFNPQWALAAQALYMRDLTAAAPGLTTCDTWAFGLSAYNGGLGWLRRDQRAAVAAGRDPAVWFDSVEVTPDRRRAPQFIRENRGYPSRILLKLTPIYAKAGYGIGIVCRVHWFGDVSAGVSSTAPQGGQP